MSGNLLTTLMGMATPDVVSQLSQALGESGPATTKGLGVALPALLAGASKLAASDNGASLTRLIQSAGVDQGMLNNISGYLSSTNPSSLANAPSSALSSLFGPATGGVLAALGSLVGLRASSASSLMGVAAPLVLGFLGKHQATNGLSASGLAGLLSSQSGEIAKALPPEISSLLGLTTSVTQTTTHAMPHAVVTKEDKGFNWWWLAIPLLALLGFFGLRGCDNKDATPVVKETAAPAKVESPCSHYKLPDGNSVELLPDSFGCAVATYLEKGTEVPKTFVFDHLEYDFGTTNLTADSKGTVAALATLLKAYPNANIELAGHTDNVGDPAANLALSEARAKAIKEMLVATGIDESRITTVGYGETKPIAPNDTDEGRQKNRRTELTVTKK